ncbi:hypothetical protein [Methylobacter luteus]|uniref:hypothetical protein n=1 Tax=Methylobacter luteus TaxID=415 RepID=UPI000487EE12|nr:hypothetical protein [Methylobacter luteus]
MINHEAREGNASWLIDEFAELTTPFAAGLLREQQGLRDFGWPAEKRRRRQGWSGKIIGFVIN